VNVINDVTNRRAIGTVILTFSTKVADKQTHERTDTSTDSKGRLNLAAREPTTSMLFAKE